MLVLTRKQNQSIRIGDVVITVCRIKDGTVRIGIEAPKDVEIQRLDEKRYPPPTTGLNKRSLTGI